jgi:hypothetical protein
LFTACGAVTSHYKIDVSKFDIKCRKMKCVIKSKSKAFVPNVSVLKCMRGKYNHNGNEIKGYGKFL